MKLKPIIVSMIMLGLAAPAFADESGLSPAAQSQLDAMKAQLDKMEAVINQNNAGGFAQYNDWFKRITLSGMVNVDFQQANTVPNFVENPNAGNSNNISLSNANILLDAIASDWTKVHIGLVYDDNRSVAFDRESNTSSSVLEGSTPSYDTLDEAYVTLGNFSEYPMYLRAGKEYVPFGVYQRFPMLVNPTQLLSETQETAVQLGFVSRMGFYGSAYTFRGISKDRNDDGGTLGNERPRVENYGADVGYAYNDNSMSAKLDVGYIDNMADVRYVANTIGLYSSTYQDRAHGLSASGDLTVGPFDAGLRYVTALESFDAFDVSEPDSSATLGVGGAKPAAFGADAGYSFPVLAHQTRLGAGYQHTWDSASFAGLGVGGYGLPLDRYYGDYVVNVSKWTDIGLEVFHDRDYSVGEGGSGGTATGGVLRLGVKFA